MRKYSIEALRNQVPWCCKKCALFGTIKENLRWGNKEATDEEMIQACKLACATSSSPSSRKGTIPILSRAEPTSPAARSRGSVSPGPFSKAKILILDDSTSAVDTKTDASIRRAMKTFIPETTKIIIAQRTASVEDADRIIVMEAGASTPSAPMRSSLRATRFTEKSTPLRIRQVIRMKTKKKKVVDAF